MDVHSSLAEAFEEQRSRLRGVAYRMLGSIDQAEDAVQEAWLRLSRTGADDIDNLAGWLTTVVARVCLNALRSRNVRKEQSLGVHVPDPIVSAEEHTQPEEETLLADSVGLAMLVVLDTLAPAERLAFVLHDMFGLPFDEIAGMLERSPVATRQLASRARRRVRGAAVPSSDEDLARQRAVVDAFFAAARHGDFDALVAMLDPDVVLRIDAGAGRPFSMEVRGADEVGAQSRRGLKTWISRPAVELIPVVVNGAAGVVLTTDGEPTTVMGFTVAGGRVVEIDVVSDPDRVPRIAGALLGD